MTTITKDAKATYRATQEKLSFVYSGSNRVMKQVMHEITTKTTRQEHMRQARRHKALARLSIIDNN